MYCSSSNGIRPSISENDFRFCRYQSARSDARSASDKHEQTAARKASAIITGGDDPPAAATKVDDAVSTQSDWTTNDHSSHRARITA